MYLKTIIKKANKFGKHVGTIATRNENVNQFLEMGVKYITYLVDCEVLRSGYETVVNSFNEKLKK